MNTLPTKIETTRTKIDRLWNVIALTLFIASILYTIIQWPQLPSEVPAHFNGAGEVDQYGSKWMLLLLPMIGAGMYALLEFLERHPEWHNYPRRLNESNAAQFYQLSRTLLNRIKGLTVILFAYLQWEIVHVALSGKDRMSMWGTGILIGLMMIFIFLTFIRQSKIK